MINGARSGPTSVSASVRPMLQVSSSTRRNCSVQHCVCVTMRPPGGCSGRFLRSISDCLGTFVAVGSWGEEPPSKLRAQPFLIPSLGTGSPGLGPRPRRYDDPESPAGSRGPKACASMSDLAPVWTVSWITGRASAVPVIRKGRSEGPRVAVLLAAAVAAESDRVRVTCSQRDSDLVDRPRGAQDHHRCGDQEAGTDDGEDEVPPAPAELPGHGHRRGCRAALVGGTRGGGR